MKRKLNKSLEVAANRKATIVILVISIAIMRILKKYGREQKD